MAGAPASPRPASADSRLSFGLRLLVPLLLALATAAAFWPCVNHEFVALDDDANFQLNFLWRGFGAEQFDWLWNRSHYGHWHPLTWLTFCAEYVLWAKGPNGDPLPEPLHRTNLAIHVLGAVAFYALVLELLHWIGGFASSRSDARAPSRGEALALRCCALLGAAVWAMHPLRVESVAWVTERRDLLSGVFLSITVYAYLRATRRGGSYLSWMGLALVAYLASLLSKAWGITAPVVLLALDLFPLQRVRTASREGVTWNRILVEKLAFGAIALWAAIRAAEAQADINAVMSLSEHGVMARAAQASYGLCFYLLKSVWPTELSCHHLLELDFAWDKPIYLAAMGAVLTITVVLGAFARRWPAGFATWFLYAVLVSPVLGILQSGAQKVADRYAYIASMPLSVLIAAGALSWVLAGGGDRLSRRLRAPIALTFALASVLGVLTWRQTKVWANSEALFRNAVEVEPDNYFVAHNLAVTLWRRNAFAEALEVEKASVAAHPGYGNYQARYTLGLLYQRLGQPQLAEQTFRETVAIAPDCEPAFAELRRILGARRDEEGLFALYASALDAGEANRRADPRRPVVTNLYVEYARMLLQRGRKDEARALWERASAAGAPAAIVENGIGRVLMEQGRLGEAEERLTRAQQYDPRNKDFVVDLCELFLRQGRAKDAYDNANNVLAVDPNHARALNVKRQAQARLGGG